MSAVVDERGRPRALQTILVGGSIAGLLDGLDAVVFYRLAFAVPPASLFQFIASGLMGPRSFGGGWHTVVLGVALHFSIAIGAATVYYAASLSFLPSSASHGSAGQCSAEACTSSCSMWSYLCRPCPKAPPHPSSTFWINCSPTHSLSASPSP